MLPWKPWYCKHGNPTKYGNPIKQESINNGWGEATSSSLSVFGSMVDAAGKLFFCLIQSHILITLCNNVG